MYSYIHKQADKSMPIKIRFYTCGYSLTVRADTEYISPALASGFPHWTVTMES